MQLLVALTGFSFLASDGFHLLIKIFQALLSFGQHICQAAVLRLCILENNPISLVASTYSLIYVVYHPHLITRILSQH